MSQTGWSDSGMTPLRFVMVGGFLGAGKTTTVARLAAMYRKRGVNIGIVTNDQAADLVDTHSLRSQGYDVGEVAGACFCCNFNELTDTVQRLETNRRPDLILAEPVGSCTDLVATVLQPLMGLFGQKFRVAPYAVILKPSHGLRILRNDKRGGFSPNAEYIFRKQIEEADVVLVNRIDELTREQLEEITALLEKHHPGLPVLRISAKTGEGFDGLVEFLDQEGDFGRRILDLDYDLYAAGEAELGWLNGSLTASANEPFSLDALLLGIVEQLRKSLDARGAETAHLKTIGLWEGYYGVANLVSRDGKAELSLPSNRQLREANVIVNARVAIDPTELETLVRQAVDAAASDLSVRVAFEQAQSFRPSRPVPTHRYAAGSI
jgi:Ni2+-binding GTPase involved in maturation of urease and hydrogenase